MGLQAMYGNELTGLCRPEELMQLFAYATRLGRQYGVPVDNAMISDVPGYTWGVVPVMAQAGVKYWSIGPNLRDRIGATRVAWEDKPFYWVSPSGKTQVLCALPYIGYALSHITPPEEKRERQQRGCPWMKGMMDSCGGVSGGVMDKLQPTGKGSQRHRSSPFHDAWRLPGEQGRTTTLVGPDGPRLRMSQKHSTATTTVPLPGGRLEVATQVTGVAGSGEEEGSGLSCRVLLLSAGVLDWKRVLTHFLPRRTASPSSGWRTPAGG